MKLRSSTNIVFPQSLHTAFPLHEWQSGKIICSGFHFDFPTSLSETTCLFGITIQTIITKGLTNSILPFFLQLCILRTWQASVAVENEISPSERV